MTLNPDNESKEYTTEIVKKLDCQKEDDKLIFTNIKMIDFTFFYNLLSREAKRDMIHRLISQIEISRDSNYNIDIENIKFTDEFITKSSKDFIKYLIIILFNEEVGIKYLNKITKEELKIKEKDYDVLSILKMKRNEYPSEFVNYFFAKAHSHFYIDGIIGSPYIEENAVKDFLLLVPKKEIAKTNQKRKKFAMKLLTKENILKNQVDTIEQFKVLAYLKKQLFTPEFAVYLIDRFTIKVIDKNK